jgi:hypothetical protein
MMGPRRIPLAKHPSCANPGSDQAFRVGAASRVAELGYYVALDETRQLNG